MVILQSGIFQEPGESPGQPLAAVSLAGHSNTRKEGNALRRWERLEQVMHALGRLMNWAMAERRAFMTKTMGVAPPTSKRVQQGLEPDLPHVIDADMSGVHAFQDSEDGEDDSLPCEPELKRMRCSFVRGGAQTSVRSAVGGPTTSRKQEDNVVDLMSDNILPASILADVAF